MWESTTNLENVLDTAKETTGLQLPEKFEDTFKASKENRLKLVSAAKDTFTDMTQENKTAINDKAALEIQSWTKMPVAGEDGYNGKIAVLYLYTSLSDPTKVNPSIDDVTATFNTLHVKKTPVWDTKDISITPIKMIPITQTPIEIPTTLPSIINSTTPQNIQKTSIEGVGSPINVSIKQADTKLPANSGTKNPDVQLNNDVLTPKTLEEQQDGTFYTGTVDNTWLKTGDGILYKSDKTTVIYDWEWKNNEQNGAWKLTNKDWSTYTWDIIDGSAEWIWTYTNPNGVKFTGTWKGNELISIKDNDTDVTETTLSDGVFMSDLYDITLEKIQKWYVAAIEDARPKTEKIDENSNADTYADNITNSVKTITTDKPEKFLKQLNKSVTYKQDNPYEFTSGNSITVSKFQDATWDIKTVSARWATESAAQLLLLANAGKKWRATSDQNTTIPLQREYTMSNWSIGKELVYIRKEKIPSITK